MEAIGPVDLEQIVGRFCVNTLIGMRVNAAGSATRSGMCRFEADMLIPAVAMLGKGHGLESVEAVKLNKNYFGIRIRTRYGTYTALNCAEAIAVRSVVAFRMFDESNSITIETEAETE